MKYLNRKADGSPRLGRPSGPSRNRGNRPWDSYNARALYTVAANPDLERYRIAEYLGLSPAQLSNITCTRYGVVALERFKQLPREKLAPFKIASKGVIMS